jgi:hypothetical protein
MLLEMLADPSATSDTRQTSMTCLIRHLNPSSEMPTPFIPNHHTQPAVCQHVWAARSLPPKPLAITRRRTTVIHHQRQMRHGIRPPCVVALGHGRLLKPRRLGLHPRKQSPLPACSPIYSPPSGTGGRSDRPLVDPVGFRQCTRPSKRRTAAARVPRRTAASVAFFSAWADALPFRV